MWDLVSFIVGLIIGLIIMVIIAWALYSTRRDRIQRLCRFNDYHNNPNDAINSGHSINGILFINEKNQMVYKRPTATSDCIPVGNSQVITIDHPQWCLFTDSSGHQYHGKNDNIRSPFYKVPGTDIIVQTGKHCSVKRSDCAKIVSGRPLLKWES